MSEYLVKDTELTAVADAIRAKTGGTDAIAFPDGFASAITEITTGIDSEVLEDVAVTLDFSGGNQTINAGDGYVVKTAIIQKPETLIPENIAEGVDIAGVTGSLVTGGGGSALELEETALIFTDMDGIYGNEDSCLPSLKAGATYDVTWDSTVYTCTAVANGNDIVLLGNLAVLGGEDTGEPFFVMYNSADNSAAIASPNDTAEATHTVSIKLNFSAGDSGSDEQYALITVTVKREGAALAGASVTATKGTTVVTETTDENGQCVLRVTETGTYTITSTYDGFTSSSGSVTVSGFSYTTSNTFFSATITVATETGATVTVTNGDRTYTATGEDMQAVITVYETGAYTVTSEYNGNSMTKSVDVTASTNYKLSMFSSHLILEDTPWESISAISAEGNPENYFAIGDTKSVHLNGTIINDTFDVTLYAYIIGFNHNESIEGKGIHFGTFKTADGTDVALVESNYGNSTSSGYGFSYGNPTSNGYAVLVQETLGQTLSDSGASSVSGYYYIADDSLIDTPKTNSFMEALPTELRSVMKKFRKYHGENLKSSVYYAELFINLLSSYEVTGALHSYETDYSAYVKQYEYFAQGNTKIKYKHNATSTACIWFLRGACNNSTTVAGYGLVVNGSGTITYLTSSTRRISYGLAPIFVV